MSRSTDLVRLMTNARINIPAALDSAIKNEFFLAVNEFLDGSNLWTESISFTTDPDSTDQNYQIIPERGTITRLMGIKNANDRDVQGSMAELGVLILPNTPPAAEEWTAVVALMAEGTDDNDYPEFPDWILAKYHSQILDGIMARMFAQPAKPYSSGTASQARYGLFRRAIATARVDALRQNGYGAQNWTYPQAFASSRRR